MSTEKFTNDKIEDLLKKKRGIEVPAELLGKLVDEIPEKVDLHPDVSGELRRKTPLYRRPWALAAAAVFAVAITGTLSWEVYQNSIGRLGESIVAEKVTAPSATQQEQDNQTPPQLKLRPKPKVEPTEALSESEESSAGSRSTPETTVGRTEVADESQMDTLPRKPVRAEGGDARKLLPRTIQVVDPEGIPLPGVAISVESREKKTLQTAITDATGKAHVVLPNTGEHTASVAIPGFVARKVELPEPDQGGASEMKVRLSPEPFVGETVSVTAESPRVDTSKTLTGSLPASKSGRGGRDLEYRIAEKKRSRVHDRPTEDLILGVPDAPPPAPPSTGGDKEPNAQPYGDVFFSSEGVNPFVDTDDDHLSTFGLEVDTASYSVARRYLKDGNLPPPEAIRVEEFLNSFDYGDKPPRRGDFRLILEGAPSAFAPGPGYQTLRVALKAREVREDQRPPAILVFCVDVSGSMARENRLGLVKRALRELLDHLRTDDQVGLVVYGSRGRVLLEPTHNHEAIDRAIARLEPGGSTNAEEGLVLAYRLLDEVSDGEEDGRIRRVILCSDGVANVGRTGADQILERIRHEKESGVELSTVGFGMGNYNDVLMERLADAGDGRYAYVDSIDEARKIFVEELTGNLMTIARDAKAQVEFDPDIVSRWRLIGYENRDIEDSRFRDPTVDAGEIGAGHSVTALYQIKLRPGAGRRDVAAIFRLRYRPRNSKRSVELDEKLRVGELASSWRRASPALQLASQVAAFAELLRHSYWSRGINFEDILDHLESIRRSPTPRTQMRELEDLISRASCLKRGTDDGRRE